MVAAAVGRIIEHANETLRGRHRIAARPVPARDLHAVVVGDIVERPSRKLRKQLPREAHRAQLRADQVPRRSRAGLRR